MCLVTLTNFFVCLVTLTNLSPSLTFTGAQLRASCRAVSPPGMATDRPQWQGSPEDGEFCTTHHRGQTTCPPGRLQHPMSQESKKDNQGHCLFTPLLSRRRGQYRYIKAGTERLKNSFYLKAITSTERQLPTYRLDIIGHFNKWYTSHFNNVMGAGWWQGSQAQENRTWCKRSCLISASQNSKTKMTK